MSELIEKLMDKKIELIEELKKYTALEKENKRLKDQEQTLSNYLSQIFTQ